MRRALAGMAALGLALVGTPVASAHDNSAVTSRCFLEKDASSNSQPQFGRLYGYAIAPETGGGMFSCRLVAAGSEFAWAGPLHGEGAFVTASGVPWVFDPDTVELCAHIDWDDGHPPYERCEAWPPAPTQVPPQGVIDLLNDVFELTDPPTCWALRTLAPGVPGLVDVDPVTGDTSVFGERFWDCPPYGD